MLEILNMFKDKKIAKILTITSFLFMIFAMIIIANIPPAEGYELSIYASYPAVFWFFLFVGIFLSLVVMLGQVFVTKPSRIWILAFVSILMWNFVFMMLPYFRGYLFYGGANADIFSHLGFIKEIETTGHVFDNNFYPIIHTFILSLSKILGVSVNRISWFIPVFFSTLYALFMALLAKIISKNKQQAILITILSSLLVFSTFHLTMHPSFFSFAFLPLLIYLHHKRNDAQKKLGATLLIITLCFFIVFFHPMTTLIAIVMFSTFILSSFLFKKLKLFLRNAHLRVKFENLTNILIILVISFITWYTSHLGGLYAIQSIYQGLFHGSEVSIATDYLSTLSIANLSLLQTLYILFLRYGTVIIFATVALLCLLIVAKRLFKDRKIKELEFSYTMQLFASFVTGVVMLFGYVIVANPIRSSRYFIMILTIFNGLILYSVLRKKPIKFPKPKKVKNYFFLGITVVLIFFSCTICLLNVHPSPNVWETNQQVTSMNFAGSSWLVTNRDKDFQVSETYGANLWRMGHYIYGVTEGEAHFGEVDSFDVPTGFSYNVTDRLIEHYEGNITYMVTTENSRQAVNVFPDNVKPKVHQYTEEDIYRLNLDTSVNKIYENGEQECFLIID